MWSRRRTQELLIRIEVLERRQEVWDERDAQVAWIEQHWRREHMREVAYLTKHDPEHRNVAAWVERDEITRGARWIGSWFNEDDWEQAAYEQELLLKKYAQTTTVDADPRQYARQEFSVVHVPERKYGV
jgi:hypothetical protein